MKLLPRCGGHAQMCAASNPRRRDQSRYAARSSWYTTVRAVRGRKYSTESRYAKYTRFAEGPSEPASPNSCTYIAKTHRSTPSLRWNSATARDSNGKTSGSAPALSPPGLRKFCRRTGGTRSDCGTDDKTRTQTVSAARAVAGSPDVRILRCTASSRWSDILVFRSARADHHFFVGCGTLVPGLVVVVALGGGSSTAVLFCCPSSLKSTTRGVA
mmetsp:Transcript_15561/g.62648  ORF Transcript_15561/g.62648 Transcript_15561/m.62648 type:complete len:214 (+) Transcript_15561:3254-3895(+)